MAIKITENGVVNYENEPNVNRELFPNTLEGGGSPEQIAQAVDNWLEDHPEATTTVTDGSITREKLDSELNSYIEDITNLETNKQDVLTFDSAPTAESTNPVTSGGVKASIDDIAKTVDGMTSDDLLESVELISGTYLNDSGAETVDANSVYYDYLPVEYGKYNLHLDIIDESITRAFTLRVIAYDANHENTKLIRKLTVQAFNTLNQDLTVYIDYGIAYIRVSLYTYSRVNSVELRQYFGQSYYTAVDAVARDKAEINDRVLFKVVHKNLIDRRKMIRGSMDLNTGIPSMRVDGTGDFITDFIPIEKNVGYGGRNVSKTIYYDESKTFVKWDHGVSTFIQDEVNNKLYYKVKYIRLVISVENEQTCVYSYAKYYDPEITYEYDDIVYEYFSEKGNSLYKSGVAHYASLENNSYVKSGNLFDFDTFTFGFAYNLNREASYVSTKNNDMPASVNDGCNIMNYIPVSPGQALCVSHDCWNSPYYDETKTRLNVSTGEILHNRFVIVPEGAAYVRLNVKGSTNLESQHVLHSRNDMRDFAVWTVDSGEVREPQVYTPLPMYQIDGKRISANYLDIVTPNMFESPFISAMKCFTIREMNARDGAYRFGNFNTWVSLGNSGWDLIRKMLMDYGVDFCGFEEVARGTETAPITLANFLKSWQFNGGFMSNYTDGVEPIDKSFVSRFPVISSTKFFTTSSGSSVAGLNCKVQLPRYNDVYNPKRILSVYVVHLPITSNTYKVSVANEIIAIMAQDTSDFIVIAGDTNDFADTEEGKLYWRTFEAAGYRPLLPMSSKTITSDNLDIVEGDPDKQWRHHAIDQFLVSSNITMLHYGVVNTKDSYGLEARGNATDNVPALSDHDFVWADLVFNYDTPRDNMPVINETEEPTEETGN